MPNTVYYRKFPSSNQHGRLPSPNLLSVCSPTTSTNVMVKRKASPSSMEQNYVKSLGPPPSKLRKLTLHDATPWRICPPSQKAARTGSNNMMQEILKPIIDDIKPGFQRSDKKEPISLATADASLAHIPPFPKAMEALVRAVLRKPQTSLYAHSCGTLEARHAIASHHTAHVPGQSPTTLSPDHVIVTNGCSAALDLALASILDPGTSLLVPNPGFPLYEEIAESHGATAIHYNLDPNKHWECDLEHLQKLLEEDSRKKEIRAMVINNPSSHGAVFSEEHLLQLLEFAGRHKLLLIADEVYGDLTFGRHTFFPLAKVAAQHGSHVPIITTSGLSKQFLVPGWRLGWVVFHDNRWGSLGNILAGAQRLAKLQHGISHVMQSAIPTLLSPRTPGLVSWKQHLRSTLERQANLLSSRLQDCQGLQMKCPPQGSMYAILHLDFDAFFVPGSEPEEEHENENHNNHQRKNVRISSDVDFCHHLVREENVFCLPGSSFGVPGTIRVAFSAHETTLQKACSRIANFCHRHSTTQRLGIPAQVVVLHEQRE